MQHTDDEWIWPRLEMNATREDVVRHIVESDMVSKQWRLDVDHQIRSMRSEIRENTDVTKEIREMMAFARISKKAITIIVSIVSAIAAVWAFWKRGY
jgi:hypothetical protein